MIYGYHRTSTTDQHLDRGIAEIETFCKNNNMVLEKIYTDQQTGKNFNRPRYQVLKEDILRAGGYTYCNLTWPIRKKHARHFKRTSIFQRQRSPSYDFRNPYYYTRFIFSW